jgi:hypothetical protein
MRTAWLIAADALVRLPAKYGAHEPRRGAPGPAASIGNVLTFTGEDGVRHAA